MAANRCRRDDERFTQRAIRRRLLLRVPAVRPAGAGPRPDGRGRDQHDPGRRIGVVDLGAARRRVRPRLAASRCWTPRTSAGSTPSSARRPMPPRRGCVGTIPRPLRTAPPGSSSPTAAGRTSTTRNPGFRHLAERLIRKIVERYADHPAVIGWQVDNEPGHKLFYNHAVFQGFLRVPAGPVRRRRDPQHPMGTDLLVASAVGLGRPVGTGRATPRRPTTWPGGAIRPSSPTSSSAGRPIWSAPWCRTSQFVTTCVALGQVGQDITTIGEPLDIVGTNVYYATQDGLELPGPQDDPAWAVRVLRALGRAGLAVPAGRPLPRDPAAAVPGHRDQRDRPSAGRPTTSRPTRGSCGKWCGAWWRAARG